MGYSLTGAKNRPAAADGLGLRSGQAEPQARGGLFPRLHRPASQKALGPAVRQEPALHDDGQLGSRHAELDRRDDRANSASAAATTRRPTCPCWPAASSDSADVSDRFLWDFRRTLADMFADNHYGTMADLLQQTGHRPLRGSRGRLDGDHRRTRCSTRAKSTFPMGEFWVHALHPRAAVLRRRPRRGLGVARLRQAARRRPNPSPAAATSRRYTLKKVADYWFAQGVNRLRVPHLRAAAAGHQARQHDGRHAHQPEHHLGRAGRAVHDVPGAQLRTCCSRGCSSPTWPTCCRKGCPSSQPFWGAGLRPAPPEGYDYDCVNTDVLLNRMSVGTDGRIVLPDGMSYRVLVLPQIDRMTPPVLRKIRELVAGGATVVGPQAGPFAEPGGYPQADDGGAGAGRRDLGRPRRRHAEQALFRKGPGLLGPAARGGASGGWNCEGFRGEPLARLRLCVDAAELRRHLAVIGFEEVGHVTLAELVGFQHRVSCLEDSLTSIGRRASP